MTSILEQISNACTSPIQEVTVDSLLQRLEGNVSKSPQKQALTFLGAGSNGGVIESKFTYQDIWDETGILAENLISSGIKKGDMYVLFLLLY